MFVSRVPVPGAIPYCLVEVIMCISSRKTNSIAPRKRSEKQVHFQYEPQQYRKHEICYKNDLLQTIRLLVPPGATLKYNHRHILSGKYKFWLVTYQKLSMDVLPEADIVRMLVVHGFGGDETEDDDHSNRNHEAAAGHTCDEEGKHIHGAGDRAGQFGAYHAYAFRVPGAYEHRMDPGHEVAFCRRPLPRRRPSPQDSCRCAYRPHVHSTASPPWRVAANNKCE